MRSIPAGLAAHLQLDNTNLAFLWTIELKNGRFIRGTEHDGNVTIPPSGDSPADPNAGTYIAGANVTGSNVKSSSDMSVDNLETVGAFQEDTRITDVTVDDIESGLLDNAPVQVLVCNWKDPSLGYVLIRRGLLGPISRDSDARYTTEVRGLTQYLTQTIVQTYSERCNVVRLGDARCKFDVAAATVTGTVTSVTDRKSFAADLAIGSPSPLWGFSGGELTFTSGANAGFSREVKSDVGSPLPSGALSLWDELPEDAEVGDTFTLTPGCDRLLGTCRDTFDNLVNFRGYGVFIPGVNALSKGPV